jgi:hypothetical protein
LWCFPTAAIAIWLRRTALSIGCATFAPLTAEKTTAIELPAEQAGPILRFSLHTGPPGIPRPIVAIVRRFFVLPYLDVDMTSSVHDFVRSAGHYPVFLVQGRGSDTSPQ